MAGLPKPRKTPRRRSRRPGPWVPRCRRNCADPGGTRMPVDRPPRAARRPAASRRHRAAPGSPHPGARSPRQSPRRAPARARTARSATDRADHDQRVGPAPQALQHRDLAGRRLADQERHEREVAEHGLEERQLDLERMLGLVRHVRALHLRQVAEPSIASRSSGTSPSGVRNAAALGTAMPRNGTKCAGPTTTARRIAARRRRATRTHARRPARSRRSRHAARSPLWAWLQRATICGGEIAVDRARRRSASAG